MPLLVSQKNTDNSTILIINTVIICYEYLLNLDNEAKYIWKGKKEISTLFYFMMRYGGVATFSWATTVHYLKAYDSINPDFGDHGATVIFPQLLSLITYWGVQGRLAYRFYGMTNKNKPVLASMLVFLLADFTFNITNIILCADTGRSHQNITRTIFILQGSFLAVFNAVVYSQMLYKSTRILKLERELGAPHLVNSGLFLKQGLLRMSFIIITMITIISTLTQSRQLEVLFSTHLTPFQNCLTIIIPCRLILRLLEADTVEKPPLIFWQTLGTEAKSEATPTYPRLRLASRSSHFSNDARNAE